MPDDFDEVLFPLELCYGTKGGPSFSTLVVETSSGYEQRNRNWSRPRYKYTPMRSLLHYEHAAQLIEFFNARGGKHKGFRFRDPFDNATTDNNVSTGTLEIQNLGTGTGILTTFQLMKNYVSGSITQNRSISKPVSGSVKIYFDGVEQVSGWTVDTTTGIVTFTSIPGAGVVVGATFIFDVPVRFNTDFLELTAENYDMFNAESLELIELKL